MPLNTSFSFPTVHTAPLCSPLQTPSHSPAWLQPEWTTKLETSGFLILIVCFFFKAVWLEVADFKHTMSNLLHYFFSPKNFPSVQVLNLEKERKKDKKKGKGLSVPFPFLQLSLWECPRTCWLHVPGFWPQSLPEERKSQQLWVYLLRVPLLRVWRQSLGPKSSCPCNSVVSPYSWTNAELPLDFLQYTHSLFLPQVICLPVWKQYIYTTLNSVLWFPTCKMEVRLHTSF